MRVLVTGHHGYVGSVVTPLLVDAGHGVAGFDAYLYRGCDLAGISGGDGESVAAVEHTRFEVANGRHR